MVLLVVSLAAPLDVAQSVAASVSDTVRRSHHTFDFSGASCNKKRMLIIVGCKWAAVRPD